MRRPILLLLLLPVACDTPDPPDTVLTGGSASATYVGRSACIACHEIEHEIWAGSHHDLAMQPATEATVLGDFDDATLEQYGVTSTFSHRDGNFIVRTDGPDGALRDYRVEYVFGVIPLQQYLVAFPGGRYQPLPLCWDTRPAESGGQRWFHIYPDEPIPHTDPLHWTGGIQNWNHQCAECHSTDLRKGYDAATDTYETTWAEIDVSCEACHGPGSRHAAWAESDMTGDDPGLPVRLRDDDGGQWLFEPDAPTAKRSVPRTSHTQIDTCARCHARRAPIAEYAYGHPIHDTHRVSLLDEGLYFPDGQIHDEVYVYGSFVQSRMHREGVTCTDCHEPHSLDLIAPGNMLCGRCHSADVFDTPAHHFHEIGTPGSFCVDCHMPERTYMVVDPRRDHSLRVPRPDLSVMLGTPNACNGCHTDRPATWTLAAIEKRYGAARRAKSHYGQMLHRGRSGGPGAAGALRALAADDEAPAIARATAVAELLHFPEPESISTISTALGDPDPIVRAAAAAALESLPPEQRLPLGEPLLDDPVRGVRLAAARALAGVTPETPRLTAALEAVIASDLVEGDRPEAHMRIGNLQLARGRPGDAEQAYRAALALDPGSIQARVNLADLYRAIGRDTAGEMLLREAIMLTPDAAVPHHALGLLLVRARRIDEAVAMLGRAAQLDPGSPRFAYVYAVALQSTEREDEARGVVDEALSRHPHDAALNALKGELAGR